MILLVVLFAHTLFSSLSFWGEIFSKLIADKIINFYESCNFNLNFNNYKYITLELNIFIYEVKISNLNVFLIYLQITPIDIYNCEITKILFSYEEIKG